MGILSRLFGYVGTVRFEYVTEDGAKGTGKISIEVINMSKEEIEKELKRIVYVETGKKLQQLEIIAST